VTVNQECLETFQELKLRKKAKYIIFTLNKEKTEIIVEKTSSVNEYEDFLGDLPEAECRWAVYDFEFLNEENSKRNKIIFYSWYAFTLPPPPPLKIPNKPPLFFFLLSFPNIACDLCRSPDNAKIKDKMVSASSRDALRRSFVGIALEIQGTDYSEVAYETGGSSFLCRMIIMTMPIFDLCSL
jgi:cofilin